MRSWHTTTVAADRLAPRISLYSDPLRVNIVLASHIPVSRDYYAIKESNTWHGGNQDIKANFLTIKILIPVADGDTRWY